MISTIKSITPSIKNDDSYYGFITSTDNGKDYYFTKQNTNELSINELKVGDLVEFEEEEKDGKRKALNIRIAQNTDEHHHIELPVKFDDYEKSIIQNAGSISKITDPNDFEDAVYLLIRLLGIHTAFQFDRKNQAGKADGFFILDNLAVMYDCTLNTGFNEYKQEQIDNYVHKLNQKSQITLNVRKPDGGTAQKTISISGKKREVWIITKGATNELIDYDGIKVKEISVLDLAAVFSRRIKDSSYDIDRLSSDLTLLGS